MSASRNRACSSRAFSCPTLIFKCREPYLPEDTAAFPRSSAIDCKGSGPHRACAPVDAEQLHIGGLGRHGHDEVKSSGIKGKLDVGPARVGRGARMGMVNSQQLMPDVAHRPKGCQLFLRIDGIAALGLSVNVCEDR